MQVHVLQKQSLNYSADYRGLSMNLARTTILDFEVDTLTIDQTADQIFTLITSGRGGYQVSLNTFKILESKKSNELSKTLAQASFLSADGVSIQIASVLLGGGRIPRVPGIDLAECLLQGSALLGVTVFLLGSTDEVLEQTIHSLCARYPGLKIVGSRNGFWVPEQATDISNLIRNSGAQLCLIALPSPQKEYLAKSLSVSHDQTFFLPVGGAFEVFSGQVNRAPKWIQIIGFEWFFRFIQEPRRLWRRYLEANLNFLYLLTLSLATRISNYFFRIFTRS